MSKKRTRRYLGNGLSGASRFCLRGDFAFREERVHERLFEIKHLGKVFALVGFLFTEDLFLNELKHHVSHILALAHTPFRHERRGHRPELFKRKIPEPGKQFWPTHVPGLATVGLGNPLEREIERFFEEIIGMRIKSLVTFQDGNDGLFKLHGLHGNEDGGRVTTCQSGSSLTTDTLCALSPRPPPCHIPSTVTRPLIIWLLGDGKPGHENQTLGLAEAIARRVPCENYRVSLAASAGVLSRIQAALRASADLPAPDLILGAGHATHPALLWLTRKHRQSKSIVLMRPSLPLAWFDLCIAPTHDFSSPHPARANVILTRGALTRVISPAGELSRGRMILVGGPSTTHGWNGDLLLRALSEIAEHGHWQLTDSRRTPAGFLTQIRQHHPAIDVFSHLETPPDWLPTQLAAASEVWVTEDSVSMIYEALTSGAKVGLLPAPRLKPSSRVLRGLDSLVTDGFLTPFAEWQLTRQLKNPPESLREADRCAELLIPRL
ncbi:MAG: hypothetical protein RLZZ282_489 [Verrucomicrobiota bacterium]